MPSLPVRGFGEDGLLVTGGVGAAASSDVATITGISAQVGLIGSQQAIGTIHVATVVFVGRPIVNRPIVVRQIITGRGSQRGLLGSQDGAVTLDGSYMAAVLGLDTDLYVALREAA